MDKGRTMVKKGREIEKMELKVRVTEEPILFQRKLNPTRRMTVTASEELYDKIVGMIAEYQNFSGITDFTVQAVTYFVLQFERDISPAILAETEERIDGIDEGPGTIEFESDFGGKNKSWQATFPVGLMNQVTTLCSMYKLDPTNVIRYSQEYFYSKVCKTCSLYSVSPPVYQKSADEHRMTFKK